MMNLKGEKVEDDLCCYTHECIERSDIEPEVANMLLPNDPLAQILLVKIPLLPSYPTFRLEKAVCNHGFFMMAPNRWDHRTKTLTRPLRLNAVKHDDGSNIQDSVLVLIRHSPLNPAVLETFFVDTTQHLLVANPVNLTVLMRQVKRMLRISKTDEAVSADFQKCHPEAAAQGFGRIFRSPTLFEDIIKSILLSNCGWARSMGFAEALCKVELGPGRRNSLNNFPSLKDLADLGEHKLSKLCKLGYRANIISSVIDKVFKKHLPVEFELDHREYDDESLSLVQEELGKINGVGPFITANISMCIGSYEVVPIDSETCRHFRMVHGIENPTKKIIENMYKKYAPYNVLAYWFEHHKEYEKTFGKLSELDPSKYHLVTSSPQDHERRNSKQPTGNSQQSKLNVKKKKIVKKKKECRDTKRKKLSFTM